MEILERESFLAELGEMLSTAAPMMLPRRWLPAATRLPCARHWPSSNGWARALPLRLWRELGARYPARPAPRHARQPGQPDHARGRDRAAAGRRAAQPRDRRAIEPGGQNRRS